MAIIVDMPDPVEARVKALFYVLLSDWLTAGEVESALSEAQCSVGICTNGDLAAYAERLAERLLYGDSD
jgi:hypothetical protein